MQRPIENGPARDPGGHGAAALRAVAAGLAGPAAMAAAPAWATGAADEFAAGPAWDYLMEADLLGLLPWQWLALAAAGIIAWVLGSLIVGMVFRVLLALARRSAARWDDALIEKLAAPARMAAAVALFYAGAFALRLPERGEVAVAALCQLLASVAVAWALARLVDLFSDHIDHRLQARGDAATRTLVPLARRVAKVFVLILAVLSVLQNIGFNIAGLLAGLGIGGLAIALAAQKTLENLFGGFVLVADRPVKIGDFCQIGEHLGTVEDIGLRSSKVRTLDRTLVSIPNAELSTIRIENYGMRDMSRLYTVLQVGYDTSPDQMRWLLVELRRMLYAHPKVLPQPCRVRFMNFGAHSLDIELFVFVATTDWNEFSGIREDIFLRIMDIVAQSGACFAYPSQTLYLARDAGRDMPRSEQAEAAVAAWRSAGELPLPEFPEAMIAEVGDSLAWPPPGSASRRDAAG